MKSTLKNVLLGVIVVGLLAVLTDDLLVAFGVNNTFLLSLFQVIVPVVVGAGILLKLLDVF